MYYYGAKPCMTYVTTGCHWPTSKALGEREAEKFLNWAGQQNGIGRLFLHVPCGS